MLLYDILKRKGRNIAVVLDGATITDVAEVMFRINCGSVVIRTEAGSILGIVNERAIVKAIALRGNYAASTPATKVMLSPVPCADARTSIIDGFKTMTSSRYRHLLVTDEGCAVGIVSIGDLVKSYVHQMELENSVLRDMTAAHVVSVRREIV